MFATTLCFVITLLAFAVIGALSVLRSRKTPEDYFLAGKSVAPWLAGLSAVATNNSGYMFIGMIGLTYTTGLSSIWLMVGWLVGDFVANLLVMKQVRLAAENRDIYTFGALLARWQHTDFKRLRALVGLLMVVFLGAYAAAQLKAGSKALHVILGWEPATGAIIAAVVLLIYSWAGGIRASIWTDAAQSFVMLGGMFLLAFTGVSAAGGWAPTWQKLAAVSPVYMNWLPDKTALESTLFILGWLFGGFAVAGQPHILVRYMAFDKPEHLNRVRAYYYAWFFFFYGATIWVGLLTRILLPVTAGFDAELALPTVAQQLLPPPLVGLVLAALFAATLSTADSLVISCSSAITQDMLPNRQLGMLATKIGTALVVLGALALALSDNQRVFDLVLIAWGLLAAAFCPLILLYSFGAKPGEGLAIFIMGVGIGVFMAWRWAGLSDLVYEVAPAILAGLLAYALARWISPAPQTVGEAE